MTPERWRQITDVFHAALARDTAARRAFLDEACARDRALRDEVDARSRDGRELFYRLGGSVFAVPLDTARAFSSGKPVRLFEGRYVVSLLDYDAAPDGRFLLMKPGEDEQAPPRLNVILNWVDELTRRVPSGK